VPRSRPRDALTLLSAEACFAEATIKRYVRAVLSHGSPIQSPIPMMIVDKAMTVRSMASQLGRRVFGSVMVRTLQQPFGRERVQAGMEEESTPLPCGR